MEFLFIILQSILAIFGALLVLFTRQLRLAYVGFLCVLMALTVILLQASEFLGLFTFHGLCLFSASSLIYFVHAEQFRVKNQRPLDKHLGLSRLLASYYHILYSTLLPFWPTSQPSVPMELIRTMATQSQTFSPSVSSSLLFGSFVFSLTLCGIVTLPPYPKGTTKS